MYRFTAIPAVLIALLIIISGCSGQPTVPGLDPDITSQADTASSPHQLLGYYGMAIDTTRSTVQILPLRSSEFHLNITQTLNSTLGVSATFDPSKSDPTHGLFVMNVTLSHPFPTKTQFAGFDVKGILMTPGSLVVNPIKFADGDETLLLGADGYTRWWNPPEFTTPGMFGYVNGKLTKTPGSALTANVNPYKIFADCLGIDSSVSKLWTTSMTGPDGRGVFTAGKSCTRRYAIKFPMNPGPVVKFGYAVDASWAAPTPNPPTQVPNDFPINANQPEAYYVGIRQTANTLYFDSESGASGGVLRLSIDVYDWQGVETGNFKDQVDVVRIYSPDLMTGSADASFVSQSNNSANYYIDLTGQLKPAHSGISIMVLRVGSTDGSKYKQTGAAGPDGTLSAYQVLLLDIPDPSCKGDGNNDWTEAFQLDPGVPVKDQVCLPDDYKDFYYIDVQAGYEPMGLINLFCDAEPTTLSLFDSNKNLIKEKSVSSGRASIDLSLLDLMPQKYYLRVYTLNDIQVAPYLLEMDGKLLNIAPANPVEITNPLFFNPQEVWFKGNYLYAIGHSYLWIYDVTDMANPVFLSARRLGTYSNYARYDDYVYFLIRDDMSLCHLAMLNMANPANPEFHDNLMSFSFEPAAICMNSSEIYIGESTSGPATTIKTLHYASDPLNPTETDSVSIVAGYLDSLNLMDPEGPDTYLILGCSYTVQSYLVEDPLNWVKFGGVSMDLSGLDVRDDKVFTVGSIGNNPGIYVFTQTQINGLVDSGHYDLSEVPWTIKLCGLTAYTGGPDGLTTYDATDTQNILQTSQFPLPSPGEAINWDGNKLAVIPSYAGMELFDITEPQVPAFRFRSKVLNEPTRGFQVGNYLLTNESNRYYSALKTIDLTNPESPSLALEHPVLFNGPDLMAYDSGRLAYSSGDTSWGLVDASNPLDLVDVASGTATHDITAIAFRENAMYLAETDSGTNIDLFVYDLDQSPPQLVAVANLASEAYDMVFEDDFMYVSEFDKIEVFSVSSPLSPAFIGSYTPTNMAARLYVKDHYLYLIGGDRIEIASLSNLASPEYKSFLFLSGPPYMYLCGVIDGQYAYVSGMAYPVAVNIWPPETPSLYGQLYTYDPYFSNDLLLKDNYLLEISNFGLRIYRLYDQ